MSGLPYAVLNNPQTMKPGRGLRWRLHSRFGHPFRIVDEFNLDGRNYRTCRCSCGAMQVLMQVPG